MNEIFDGETLEYIKILLHEDRSFIDNAVDYIGELRSQLEWLPYPANKPSKRGTWLATLSDGECHADDLIFPVFYVAEKDKWNLEDEGLSHLIVTAYRPMPEAYTPPSGTGEEK